MMTDTLTETFRTQYRAELRRRKLGKLTLRIMLTVLTIGELLVLVAWQYVQ